MSDLKARALSLYKAPFKFMHGYIQDADSLIVADTDGGEAEPLRVRGWGRISYLPNAEALQDEVGAVIAEALTEYWARAAPQPAQPVSEPFQSRVQPWMLTCFGEVIAADAKERNHRFLEEALELVQACGCTADEAHQLVDYTFNRPLGEPSQEVGGVMVTLAALCLAQGLDMHSAGETELARIWTKVETIRAKQAAKPQFSPLPGPATPPAPASSIGDDAEFRGLLSWVIRDVGEPQKSFHDRNLIAYITQWADARTARQSASEDIADTARLDFLEAWRCKSLDAGFDGDTYQFIVDDPVRDQIDAARAAEGDDQ